jgi:hypothetical protein
MSGSAPASQGLGRLRGRCRSAEDDRGVLRQLALADADYGPHRHFLLALGEAAINLDDQSLQAPGRGGLQQQDHVAGALYPW